MAMPPPPSMWLADAVPAPPRDAGSGDSASYEALATELRAAARRITDAIAAEDRSAGQDLADLLDRADARDSYSPAQRGVRSVRLFYSRDFCDAEFISALFF